MQLTSPTNPNPNTPLVATGDIQFPKEFSVDDVQDDLPPDPGCLKIIVNSNAMRVTSTCSAVSFMVATIVTGVMYGACTSRENQEADFCVNTRNALIVEGVMAVLLTAWMCFLLCGPKR